MKYETKLTDVHMVKFIEKKLGIKQQYPIEIDDEIPYFRYLYEQLKEVWYALSIIDFNKDPNPEVDKLILKHKHRWMRHVMDSIWYSKKHKSEGDKCAQGILYIGVLHL